MVKSNRIENAGGLYAALACPAPGKRAGIPVFVSATGAPM